MLRSKVLKLIIACGFLAACETQGSYLKQEDVDQLQNDVQSAEQLVEVLGPPTVAIPRSDGDIVWLYRGVYKQADAGTYVPYLNFLIGTNSKTCTELSVVVSKDDGSLSDWQYKSEKDSEFWAKTDDRCDKRNKREKREAVDKGQEPG